MSTRDSDESADGGSSADNGNELIQDAMDEDAAAVQGPEIAPVTTAGRRAHAGKTWLRRPPTWAIAAAAAAVVGLVVGLLVGGGDPPPQQAAAAPHSTRAAGPSEIPQVVTTLAHIVPLQVTIPAIGVDAPLVNLGLHTDGTLEVPENFDNAGWFTGGNYPGDPSGPPSLIAGHVDNSSGPAVFFALKNLVAGDEVQVLRADNTVAVFVVTASAQYPKSEFPAAEVYAPVGDSELILITCTGDFNENARSYLDNLVVRATLNMDRSLEESNRRLAEGMLPPPVNQENV
ncbi:MAG: class F sortase [Geodermatophilaceae bacterium]|nr:class F sortase [Geodermatophilaceae bacterium]